MLTGITIRDMHELGLSYKDIDSRHGYRADESGEVVIISLASGRVTGRTGTFLSHPFDTSVETAAKPGPKAVAGAVSDALRLFSQPSQLFMCL